MLIFFLSVFFFFLFLATSFFWPLAAANDDDLVCLLIFRQGKASLSGLVKARKSTLLCALSGGQIHPIHNSCSQIPARFLINSLLFPGMLCTASGSLFVGAQPSFRFPEMTQHRNIRDPHRQSGPSCLASCLQSLDRLTYLPEVSLSLFSVHSFPRISRICLAWGKWEKTESEKGEIILRERLQRREATVPFRVDARLGLSLHAGEKKMPFVLVGFLHEGKQECAMPCAGTMIGRLHSRPIYPVVIVNRSRFCR